MSEGRREGLSSRLSSIVIKRPVAVLIAGLVFFAGLFMGGDQLKQEVSYRIWFRADDPNLAKYDSMLERFANDNALVVIVHSPSGVFDKDTASLIVELTDQMWQIPEVIRVESLSNFRWVRARADDVLVDPLIPDDVELTAPLLEERKSAALKHELLPGYLLSKDGKTALVYAWLTPFVAGEQEHVAVSATRELLKKYQERGDHVFHLTGEPVQQVAFEDISGADFEALMPLTMGFMLLVLVAVFRRVSGVILPLVLVTVAMFGALGAAGWMGLGLNAVTFLMPMIVIAVTTSATVHPLVAYFRARNGGLDKRESVRAAQDHTFLPTLFAATMIAIGFFSLVTSEIMPIRNLGIMTGIGVILSWFFQQLILMPLLVLLPLRGRKKPRKGAKEAEKPVADEELEPPKVWAQKLYGWIERRKVLIAGVGTVLTALSLFLATRLELKFDPLTFFPEKYGVREAHDFVEKEVGWVSTLDVIIDAGEAEGIKDPAFLKKVDEFQTWLKARPYVSQAISVVDIIKATNRALMSDAPDAYKLPDSREAISEELLLYSMNLPQGLDLNDRVTLDNDALRISVWWSIRDSASAIEESRAIQEKAKAMGLAANITGRGYMFHELDPYAVSTLIWSILSALPVVTLALMLVFRSFKMGLLALIPNLIPLTFGASFLFAMGLSLDFANSIAFTVALGIAIDDTVHFLSSYFLKRREGMGVRDAIVGTMSYTVPSMIITAVILVATFGMFSFASFTPNRSFGLLTSFVLAIALVTEIFLTPALLMLGDRRNMEKRPS